MSGIALGASTTKSSKVPLLALVALAAVLAGAGGLLALNVLQSRSSQSPAALPKGPFGLQQDIPISFGALGVEHVAKVKGVTAKAVASANHGIQNYVPPSKVRVQASINLTNLLERPVRYSPSQFRLIAGKGQPVVPFSSSIRPGTLQPAASIDAVISFVIPRNGQKLWLAFKDAGRREPIRVDLGRVGKRTPDSAFERFHRH